MNYKVYIRNNETGEVRERSYDFEFSLFWWKEGNFGCDCNRELEFIRAGAPAPVDDPFFNNGKTECGHGRFSVSHAILEDGTRMGIDSP